MRRTDDRRLLNDPARENAVFEKIVVFRDDRERARQFNLQKPIDDRTRNLKIVARRERVFETRGKALAAFRAFRGPVLRFKERVGIRIERKVNTIQLSAATTPAKTTVPDATSTVVAPVIAMFVLTVSVPTGANDIVSPQTDAPSSATASKADAVFLITPSFYHKPARPTIPAHAQS